MIIYYLALLVILIILLNFFRHQISQSLQIISLLIFKNAQAGVVFYSLFFLPGVIIHELSHLLFASVLGVPTGKISIFPSEIKPGNTKLGYVESAKSDPIREGLIGFAPLITGVLIIFFAGALQTFLDQAKQILVLYLLFSVANTMFVSKEDTKSWWGFLTLIILIALFIYVFQLSGWLGEYLLKISSYLWKLANTLFVLTLVDLGAFVLLYLLRGMLEKITGLRVTKKYNN